MKIEFEETIPSLHEAKEKFARAYWTEMRARCRTVREMAEKAQCTRQGAYRACQALGVEVGSLETKKP